MKEGITLVRVNLAHGSERIRVREQQIQIYAFPFFFLQNVFCQLVLNTFCVVRRKFEELITNESWAADLAQG